MDIEIIEKNIRKYAEEKNILIVETDYFDDSIMDKNYFILTSPNSIIDLAIRTNINFIILFKTKFIIEHLDYSEENIKDIKKFIDFKQEFIENFINKDYSLDLFCLINDKIFRYSEKSDLSEIFDNKIKELINEEDNLCIICKKNKKYYASGKCDECREKELKNKEAREKYYSDKLSSDEKFLKCKNPQEREIYFKETYPDVLDDGLYIQGIYNTAKALNKFKKN